MKKALLIIACVLVAGIPAAIGIRPFIGPRARPLTARRFEPPQARLDRGTYLVTSAQAPCALCHSTRDDQGNKTKGFAFAGGTAMPFEGRKTVYTANITPAVNGIPYYTEDLFVEVMRTGKVKARQLDAMMPTRNYRNMTDQDLKDVFAYLKTLTPVDHYVDNTLPPSKCPKCGFTHGGGERNKKIG